MNQNDCIDYKVNGVSYSLQMRTQKEVSQMRKENIPLLIVKKDGILYAGYVKDIKPSTPTGHLCAKGQSCCARLTAKSDEEGGCKKVRQKSKGIERCPFITDGYEITGTKIILTVPGFDCLVVQKCKNYLLEEKRLPRANISREDLTLCLFQHINPDVLSIDEMRRRVLRNESRGHAY